MFRQKRFLSRRYDEGGVLRDDLWREAEVLYMSHATPLPAPEEVPKLRWVQLYSAGADYIFDHALFQRQVTFTTASGVHAITIAEYVFTMVLT